MKLQMQIESIEWWFWFLTLISIAFALSGVEAGYWITIGLSLFQVIYFALKDKRILSFDTQVRMVYLLFTLAFFISIVRVFVYIALAVGTIMVVFFGRCSIAMVLRKMPWNQEKSIDQKSCSLEHKTI